jgi:hypothetical protein
MRLDYAPLVFGCGKIWEQTLFRAAALSRAVRCGLRALARAVRGMA